MGAVKLGVSRKGDELVGDNTDGKGFLGESLGEAGRPEGKNSSMEGRDSRTPAERGPGPHSRSEAGAWPAGRGRRFTIVNRTAERGAARWRPMGWWGKGRMLPPNIKKKNLWCAWDQGKLRRVPAAWTGHSWITNATEHRPGGQTVAGRGCPLPSPHCLARKNGRGRDRGLQSPQTACGKRRPRTALQHSDGLGHGGGGGGS